MRNRRQLLNRTIVFAIVTFCCPMFSLVAQDEKKLDTVWISPDLKSTQPKNWFAGAVTTRTGEIIRFDDEQLRMFSVGSSTESVIAAERVLWIDRGSVSKSETAALKFYAAEDYQQAMRLLIDVLSERPPVWRQQWLSMMAADAARRSNRFRVALELVSQLDQRPLPPMVLAQLPIVWTRFEPNSIVVDIATEKLSDASPAVRLVAASWLLQSANRGQAVAVIDQLVNENGRPRIQQLAGAVRWRVATPIDVNAGATKWQQTVDAMPMVLQVGPTLTLIEKFDAAGRLEKAERLRMSLKLTPPFPHPDIPKAEE